MKKCCHLTAISLSLLRKENGLNSQELSIFSGNPYVHSFLPGSCCVLGVLPVCSQRNQQHGKIPRTDSIILPTMVCTGKTFFFSAWHSSFPKHNANCKERSCSEKICIYWDILYFIWCRLWSFWENLPQSTNAAGQRMLTLGMTFCCAAQFCRSYYNVIICFKNIFCC